jgi:hypothetical protein
LEGESYGAGQAECWIRVELELAEECLQAHIRLITQRESGAQEQFVTQDEQQDEQQGEQGE